MEWQSLSASKSGGNQGREGYNSGGFISGFNGFGSGGGKGDITCQFYLKSNHSATKCKNRFNRNFVLNLPV